MNTSLSIVNNLRKLVIYILTTLFVIQPLLFMPSKTSAADPETVGSSDNIDNPSISDAETNIINENESDVDETAIDKTKYQASTETIVANKLSKLVYPESDQAIFNFIEQAGGMSTAKIVLYPDDLAALKALYYIGSNAPDFENNLNELWNNLPASDRPASEDDLLKVQKANPAQFALYVKTALKSWTKTDNGNKLKNVKAISMVTGLPINQINEMPEATRNELYSTMMDSLQIDVRVLKTLVYLVTPKDQGGAGHWRLKVRKISQFAGRPLSTESDAVLLSNNGKTASDTSSSANCSGLTAAECGRQLPAETTAEAGTATSPNTTAEPDLTVTDQNGDEREGYISGIDTEIDALASRNISAHSTGQAIDVSQIDDIRCTLIKKRRLTSNTYTPQPANPIKLAWQTNEGYSDSGGNPIDSMGIMKAALNDDVRDLISSLGGDVTTYEGDLSNANLSDVVGIVGKSMFAQILNSPSHNLSGYDASETLKNLGTMYFADYFGLPREIFLNREFNSIDDIQEIIGESAIEKRLNLPFGSLSSKNFLKTLQNQNSNDPLLKGKAVYDLEGTFLNIGQRKLEYEMGLNTGDLDTYVSQSATEASSQDLDLLIGKRVIEKGLNLKKEMFSGNNLSELEAAIGHIKYELMFRDPTYLDNLFHLKLGTSRKLLAREVSPNDYARNVGTTRKADTINGLRYFAANDAAYNLPTGTWEGMMLGKKQDFITAGSFTLGRLIGDNQAFSNYIGESDEVVKAINAGDITVKATPADLGTAAIQQWLKSNLLNTTATNENACKKPDEILVPVTVDVQYKKSNSYSGTVPTSGTKTINVKLGEEKALTYGLEQDDLFNMFGCAEANTKYTFERIGSKILFYGIANNFLSDKEKAKINLLDTDPQFKIDNPEIMFYLSRIENIKKLMAEIKADWDGEGLSDPTLVAIKANISAIYTLINKQGLNLLDTQTSKRIVRDLIQRIAQLQQDLQKEKGAAPDKIVFINNTIININTLLRNASEILAGKAIQSADSITINQIDSNILKSSGSSDRGASGEKNTMKNSMNVNMIFNLLSRNLNVVEFFMKLGCSEAEAELGLPENALYYLIQNYEKNGIKGVDAFYAAIGQAQVEENFTMPSFYFQGDEFGLNAPDFAKNLPELYKYAKPWIDNIRVFMSAGMTSRDLNMDNDAFLKYLNTSSPDTFDFIVGAARTNWRSAEDLKTKSNGGISIVEKTVNDIVKNIDRNKLADGIRSGTTDLMLRMGLSNTNLANITNGNIDTTTEKRLSAIDRSLGLRDGSTKALFRGSRAPLADGESLITVDQKKQLEASADIRTNSLDQYLKLLNGQIKVEDIKDLVASPDYFITNPYAAQNNNPANACPVNFQLKPGSSTKGDFVINETFLEEDSYCLNDKNGRHCFRTKDEANRYKEEHQSDMFEDVLDSLAFSLVGLLGLTNVGEFASRSMSVKAELIKIINKEEGARVFTEEEYLAIDASNTNKIKTGGSAVPIDLLKKLFSNNVSSPLTDYKIAVGMSTAGKVLSNKLFEGLGFRIDASLIDSSLFYEILNGNFSAVYELGATMIEQFIGEKAGTIRAIIRAANVNTLSCALGQAGSSMLGGLLGLESVSLRGNILNNIGQTMVEETLMLPKGSFSGTTISQVITTAQPINFALSFKIPMGITNPITGGSLIKQMDLKAILGVDEAEQIKDASDQYKLEKIQDKMNQNPDIGAMQLLAMSEIERALEQYISELFKDFSYKLSEEPGEGYNESNKNLKPFYNESKRFNQLLAYMDSRFWPIAANNSKQGYSAKLFQKIDNVTPDAYLTEVGKSKIADFGIDKLAESLGFNEEATAAIKDVIKNINSVFNCNAEVTSTFGIVGSSCNANFGKWSILYTDFSKIFNFNLDDKANYTPGTFATLLDNPNHAVSIILGEEAKKLDRKLGIKSEDDYSFYALYERWNSLAEAGKADRQLADDLCANDISELTANRKTRTDIIANSESTTEQKESAIAELTALDAQIKISNTAAETCRKNNRKSNAQTGFAPGGEYLATALEWTQYKLSEEIRKNIKNIIPSQFCSGNVSACIDMPLEDIRQLVFHGNIQYLEIAATSMAANYITNKITGEPEAVPDAMRISYADIKNAYFPDQSVVNSASNYAVWAEQNGMTYNAYASKYGYGDACPIDTNTSSNMLNILVSCTDDNTAYKRDTLAVNNGVSGMVQQGYTCTDETGCVTPEVTATYAEDQANLATANSERAWDEYVQAQSTLPAGCDEAKAATDATCKTSFDNLTLKTAYVWETNARVSEISNAQFEAQRNVKQAFKDSMQYKLSDQMLWKIDNNVYPGFSRALFKGDASVKQAAIARYLKNALINGKIFGVEFGAVENLDKWLATARFIFNKDANYDFNEFVKSGAFGGLSNYVNSNFEKWFNFSLPAGMADGLLLGLFTNNWGSANESGNTVSFGGRNIPSFKGAAVGWAEGQVFGWVDKQIGLPAGTSLGWYTKGKQIYDSAQKFSKINNLMNSYMTMADGADKIATGAQLDKLLSNDTKKQLLEMSGNTKVTSADIKNFKIDSTAKLTPDQQNLVNNKLKEAKAQAINGAILGLATEIVLQFLHQLLGNTLSDIESSLGLTPGSLSVLFDAGVTYGVQAAAHALAPSSFGAASSAGLWIALAIFVIMNLFGVYKVELTCSADGYYPSSTNPQPSINDISGLGEWDGMNAETNKSMSIKAAQYKAKRLIQDVLSMHENPLFADVYPSQIMTGRQEDADALEYSIQTNICDKIGEKVKNGICGGDSSGSPRAGVWSNPQTVAWTHIGF